MQTGKTLIAYLVLDGVTLESKSFPVRKRERPENYVYEDDQRNYIYELITDAENAVKAANTAAETAVATANAAAETANRSATNATQAATSATTAAENADEAANNANTAAGSAYEVAAKVANTAKNFMVIGKAEGDSISLDDAVDQFFVGLRIFGKTTQDGTPTPDAPVELVSVGNNGSITVNVTGKNDAQSMTLATPNGLPGIPVTSGGNYTDANGQQWICDEIDPARGVYVKRVRTVVLSGTGTVPWKSLGSVGECYRFTFTLADIAPKTKLICDHFAYQGEIPTPGIEGIYAHGTANTPSILIATHRIGGSEVSTWLAYLMKNPIKAVYQITSPIETPLSEEDLAAYAALHTYRGTTTVSNDASAHMEIEYVMDAKKYIDRMIATGVGSIIPATVE